MAGNALEAFHQHLPANMIGRDFFVGDIHGRLDALLLAMGDVSFNPKTDRVIAVGDLIDRGLNSYELLKLTRERWFFSVRGNHEAMLMDATDHFSLSLWLSNGGDWYMDLDGEAALDCCAIAHSLPTAFTVGTRDGKCIGVCHAEWPENDWADIDTHLNNQHHVSAMLWGRRIIKGEICRWDKSATLTVHGHTPIEKVKKLGSALFIDTGCVHGGHLTLIESKDALALPSLT
ncbi:MAG: metallophosphoesterase [Kordiimonas sp.]